MPKELVYTSAIKGLKPGTRGFCTVAASSGIAPPLQILLESLSGYRHLFPPNTPEATNNPIIFSHLTIPNHGVGTHLISRIADAGLDYTGRTNKIAHHLVLDDSEISRTDPIILFDGGISFCSQWLTEPQIIAPPRSLPTQKSSVQVCSLWQKICGDAGYGAILAGAILAGRQVSVIYKLNQPILHLFLESCSLLPYDRRWQATFSTYATKLPPGIRCQWRAALAGSQEEAYIRSIPDVIIIDLNTPAPLTSFLDKDTRTFLEAARTGKSVSMEEQERKLVITRVPTLVKRAVPEKNAPTAEETGVDFQEQGSRNSGLEPPAFPEDATQNKAIHLLSDIYDNMGKEKKKRRWGLFSCFLVLILLTALAAFLFFYFYKSEKKHKSEPKDEIVHCVIEPKLFASDENFLYFNFFRERVSGR